MSELKNTNRLINETSPYLLQHAHNPVDWYPWGEEALSKARKEDKLLLVSIGYSACHWCHVMERECFEDQSVAKIMNDNYVCIKVDREERPDIDHLYMDAANLMKGRGGWPLNAFALPDGRPVYAETFFPKPQWTGLLRELAFGYKKDKSKYIDYAEKLLAGIKSLNFLAEAEKENILTEQDLKNIYQSIYSRFDKINGGLGNAPKFPMPIVYRFLLRYYHAYRNEDCLKQINLTLHKMALGGIYDQIGGGFTRYATDEIWLVPHFEKMLYDNAQLITLFAEAFQLTKIELYKNIVYQTVEFLQRELSSGEAYYSALDADSEGEEGKYYVWTEAEFDNLFGNKSLIIKEYFGIGSSGYWENGLNIPIAYPNPDELALKHGITLEDLNSIINQAKELLLSARKKRIRPGLDNKIILSWNALAIESLLTAYKVFNDEKFLEEAEKALGFIINQMVLGNTLCHSLKTDQKYTIAFLEDYSCLIAALLQHYQCTFIENSLSNAKNLTDFVIQQFSDEENKMFYFTDKTSTELPVRKIDLTDNVIPSPNSIMALNLLQLGHMLDEPKYIRRANLMLMSILPQVSEHASFYSNWAILTLLIEKGTFEVAITGPEAKNTIADIEKTFIPNKVLVGSIAAETGIPLLKGKYPKDNKTLIYICKDKTCLPPFENVNGAVDEMMSF